MAEGLIRQLCGWKGCAGGEVGAFKGVPADCGELFHHVYPVDVLQGCIAQEEPGYPAPPHSEIEQFLVGIQGVIQFVEGGGTVLIEYICLLECRFPCLSGGVYLYGVRRESGQLFPLVVNGRVLVALEDCNIFGIIVFSNHSLPNSN